MNILLISPTSGGIGGIAQHVNGLSQFLTGLGHQIDVISSANTLTIPIKRLQNPSFMISSFLKTKFKKNMDIVHAHHLAGALAMKNVSGKKNIINSWCLLKKYRTALWQNDLEYIKKI